jgi:predicted GNAT superfamily acetyltransferase
MTLKEKPQVTIREVSDLEGYRQCLRLQGATWGRGFIDLVPGSMLMIAERTGGLVLGAFVGQRMIGFVFGFAGWKGDLKIQWSDMLAVRKSYRNLQIGLRLKLRQREILRRRGVQEIYWTFDPLESKNAYFNFQKLGVVVEQYLPNLYGKTHSPLHRGLETDRFLATWRMQTPSFVPRMKRKAGAHVHKGNLINPCSLSKDNDLVPGPPNLRLTSKQTKGSDRLYLEIPTNISEISRKNFRLARQWQLCVRSACRNYLARGYVIHQFVSAAVDSRVGFFYEFCRK